MEGLARVLLEVDAFDAHGGPVDLEHAVDEGEGYRSVDEWREAHERFWASDAMRAELGDPDLVVDDATPVVLQRIRLVETL